MGKAFSANYLFDPAGALFMTPSTMFFSSFQARRKREFPKRFPSLILLVVLVLLLDSTITWRQNNNNNNNNKKLTYAQATNKPSRHLSLSSFDNNLQGLRFLTFGTSRTWGTGVKDRRLAYPYLLSPNVTNLAFKASGPQYASLCTASLVGDDEDEYDVVVLEYNLLADDTYATLALRLRQRFPQATMVFLRLWMPFQYRHVPTGENVLDMAKKIKRKHYRPELMASLLNQTLPEDWIFEEGTRQKRLIETTAQRVGAHIYTWPNKENHVETLVHYIGLFTQDMNHFSEKGHRFLRDAIVHVLRRQEQRPLLSTLRPETKTIRPWASRDRCDFWYETGKTSIRRHPAMTMVQVFPNGGYALSANSKDSWIEIDHSLWNSHRCGARIYVDYMARGPEDLYVKTRLNLDATKASIVLDPHLRSSYVIHVVRHVYVGRIPPSLKKQNSTTRLTLTWVDSQEHKQPLRIAGIVILPDDEETDRESSVAV